MEEPKMAQVPIKGLPGPANSSSKFQPLYMCACRTAKEIQGKIMWTAGRWKVKVEAGRWRGAQLCVSGGLNGRTCSHIKRQPICKTRVCKRHHKKKERAIKKMSFLRPNHSCTPFIQIQKWLENSVHSKDRQPLLSFSFHSILSSAVYVGTPFLSTLSFAPMSFFLHLSVFVIPSFSPHEKTTAQPQAITNSLTNTGGMSLGSFCSLSIFSSVFSPSDITSSNAHCSSKHWNLMHVNKSVCVEVNSTCQRIKNKGKVFFIAVIDYPLLA